MTWSSGIKLVCALLAAAAAAGCAGAIAAPKGGPPPGASDPAPPAGGPAVRELRPFSAADRVMILAAHEDDEVLGTGGVIQQALAAGAALRVVLLTYGDHNEFAFMVYRKSPIVSPTVNRGMGETRRRESAEALAGLGVDPKDVFYLGYPDHNTLWIWQQHWGDAPPLHSILTNARSVPYADAYSYGKPHKGECILADVEKLISEFRPTRIFTNHPADSNPDHRALWLYVNVALWSLSGDTPPPEMMAFPVHCGPWPRPKGLRPGDALGVPPRLAADPCSSWWSLSLSPEQVARKHEAVGKYRSQLAAKAGFHESFVRRNEIFDSPRPIALEATPEEETYGTDSMPSGATEFYKQDDPVEMEKVGFHEEPDGLLVHIALRGALRRNLGLSIFAFGFRKGRPFADVPKLHVIWKPERVTAYDGAKAVDASGIRAEVAAREVSILIPWKMLGEPERVLAEVHGFAGAITYSETTWRGLVRRTPAGAEARP